MAGMKMSVPLACQSSLFHAGEGRVANEGKEKKYLPGIEPLDSLPQGQRRFRRLVFCALGHLENKYDDKYGHPADGEVYYMVVQLSATKWMQKTGNTVEAPVETHLG
jgi:hypothetical protein